MRNHTILAAASAAVLMLSAPLGCAGSGIWARETLLGQAKRDQLVSSVESARSEQEKAKETFATALDELLAISEGDPARGGLERQFRKVESAYTKSVSRADAVRTRIAGIERVASALFEEWSDELDQYESESFRESSQQQLDATRQQYGKLIGAMRGAADTMDPVLSALKDQTLFLKHNLNAQAIASLQSDLDSIQVDVRDLIAEMEAAIAEADTFIEALGGG
ncbi:MAG: DUF2959 family protein [Planctomycetota bacterium]